MKRIYFFTLYNAFGAEAITSNPEAIVFMADPAFLFYPGDYLRDTQCLSEKSQVAYDRIMCEHMRIISEHMNIICITQEQLNFFTKRLNEDEKKELAFVLAKVKGGYQIVWVAESICKRRTYSESRAKNREGKTKKHILTYDPHMVNENEIVNEIVNKDEFEKEKNFFLNSGDWIFKFCTDKKIEVSEFDKKAKSFLSDIELKEDFKDAKELKRHFTNWFNLNTKKNGSPGAKSITQQKSDAASNYLAAAKKLATAQRTDHT